MPFSISFFIETVGCQMNALDSEIAASALLKSGFVVASSLQEADIILFNTCSIRQHAEDKVYSALGRLKQWKERKPFGLLGILGCMAQKDQKTIFRRAPHVDLVIGPGQLDLLAETVHSILDQKVAHLQESPNINAAEIVADESVAAGTNEKFEVSVQKNVKRNFSEKSSYKNTPHLLVSLERLQHRHGDVVESFKLYDPLRSPDVRPTRFQAMIRIMFGCDQFCTYCIVPSVRGPEQSRPPQEILHEVRKLIDQGVSEVTFIGQTVNSYRYKNDENTTRLPELLMRASEIEGLRRIRFVTNYPRGMSNELLQVVRDVPKIMPHLHVPAQSGSDSVLKRMKRNYTADEYRDLVRRIIETIPGASMTSDFIVGFCGETDAEFEATVDLVRECRFKNSFIFKYSERPGTKSALLYSDDVPEEVKKERNNRLLHIQDEISLELNRALIGQKVEILVDSVTKRFDDSIQLSGRTPCDRIVVFEAPDESLLGQFITISIHDSAPFTLFGKL
ncbi:MAG: MiaB/RimO family radical SAM methylthiotransferase [Thermoguttaceae bacterium]